MVSLALVTIGVLWPATGNDFLNYDDPLYVTQNAHVKAGLTMEGIRWAFGAFGKTWAWHLAPSGRRSEAITELNEALRLKPDYEEARQQLQVLGPGTR
jgi:hypothetical protein